MSAPIVSAPTVPQPNYARRGSRPPRVLLHAIGRCCTNDQILLPRQATRGRRRLPGAYHVDLPGCGTRR
jgi:hypothetical protein